uniref:Uncharacterized protein n=1 Tax=Solanum lycopersicum TaxID=4081 RepID=A0A3Q7GH78_SOLLC
MTTDMRQDLCTLQARSHTQSWVTRSNFWPQIFRLLACISHMRWQLLAICGSSTM